MSSVPSFFVGPVAFVVVVVVVLFSLKRLSGVPSFFVFEAAVVVDVVVVLVDLVAAAGGVGLATVVFVSVFALVVSVFVLVTVWACEATLNAKKATRANKNFFMVKI